jgi:hypothetical protein
LVFEYRFHYHENPIGQKRISSKKLWKEDCGIGGPGTCVIRLCLSLICQEMFYFVVVSLVEPTYYLKHCKPKCASSVCVFARQPSNGYQQDDKENGKLPNLWK